MTEIMVSQLLALMLARSFNLQSDLHKQWVTFSYRACGGDAHLLRDIQRLGNLDMVLRCLENELALRGDDIAENEQASIFTDDFQFAMSATWVLSAYEVVRLLRGRRGFSDGSPEKELLTLLELVRMPLVKGAVAKTERRESPGQPHRPTSMVNLDSGAAVWAVLSKDGSWHEISRRDLADRLLALKFDAT